MNQSRTHRAPMRRPGTSFRRALIAGLILSQPLFGAGVESSRSTGSRSELAGLFPKETLLYVESHGLSELGEKGLEHPFVRSFLATELGKVLTSEVDPEAWLSFIEQMLELPLLESLEQLTANGVALGVAGQKPEPFVALVMRVESEARADEIRTRAFELIEAKTGHAGALERPHEKKEGARLWRLGEALVLQKGALLLLGNSKDYALEIARNSAANTRASHRDSLLQNEAFHACYEQRSSAAFLWAYADREGIEASFDTKLAELADGNGKPGVHALLGSALGAMVTARTLTAQVELHEDQLLLSLHGFHTRGASRLFPVSGAALPVGSASSQDLAGGLLYRDFATLLRDGAELFAPREVPKLASAESQFSLFFSGQEVGTEVLPHVSPWIRLVSRPLSFETGPRPEIPLPGLALIARLEKPEEIGPQFLAAFQSIVSIIGVDQAQKQGRPFLLSVSTEGGVPISLARFLDPYEGDGIDMRYNLRPACAVFGDTLILGTHEELVRALVRENAPKDKRTRDAEAAASAPPTERLEIDGAPLAELIRANFETMVMNKVLEDGVTREKAEEEIAGLELILKSIRSLAIELPTPRLEHVEALLRIELATKTGRKGAKR